MRVVAPAAGGVVLVILQAVGEAGGEERRRADLRPDAPVLADERAHPAKGPDDIAHDDPIDVREVCGTVDPFADVAGGGFDVKMFMHRHVHDAGKIEVAVGASRVLAPLDDHFPAAAHDVAPGVLQAFAGLDLRGNEPLVVDEISTSPTPLPSLRSKPSA